MMRCFHSSLCSLHLVRLLSEEITFTKRKYGSWLPVCLQPDGSGAGLLALFLFAEGCIFFAVLCNFRYKDISRKYLLGVPKILHLLGFLFRKFYSNPLR